jgi:hypothetical protein
MGIFALISDSDINIGLIRLILKSLESRFLSDIQDRFDPGDPGSVSGAALVDF